MNMSEDLEKKNEYDFGNCMFCDIKLGTNHCKVISPKDFLNGSLGVKVCSYESICPDCFKKHHLSRSKTEWLKLNFEWIFERAVVGAGIIAIGVCVAKVLGVF